MATKKSAIDIKPMELEFAELTIEGITPLIVHAWEEKTMRMIADKQRGKAPKAKHDIKIPANDFKNSLYWLTEKPEDGETDEEAEANFQEAIDGGAKFGFKLDGIKQSICVGARRGGLDVTSTDLKASFFLRGATEASTFDLAEIVGDIPVIREDMVRVGGQSKSADIRYRGMFVHWEIPLFIERNSNAKYSLDQIMNCVNVGGFASGIGEWRPERDGQFGMYRVKVG